MMYSWNQTNCTYMICLKTMNLWSLTDDNLINERCFSHVRKLYAGEGGAFESTPSPLTQKSINHMMHLVYFVN